jgi:hypothetical protein
MWRRSLQRLFILGSIPRGRATASATASLQSWTDSSMHKQACPHCHLIFGGGAALVLWLYVLQWWQHYRIGFRTALDFKLCVLFLHIRPLLIVFMFSLFFATILYYSALIFVFNILNSVLFFSCQLLLLFHITKPLKNICLCVLYFNYILPPPPPPQLCLRSFDCSEQLASNMIHLYTYMLSQLLCLAMGLAVRRIPPGGGGGGGQTELAPIVL